MFIDNKIQVNITPTALFPSHFCGFVKTNVKKKNKQNYVKIQFGPNKR